MGTVLVNLGNDVLFIVILASYFPLPDNVDIHTYYGNVFSVYGCNCTCNYNDNYNYYNMYIVILNESLYTFEYLWIFL